jgi:hypothetical protein
MNISIRSRRTTAGVVAVAASLLLAAALLPAQGSAGATAPPAFKVAAGARLYVPATRPAAGRAAAWVVFRTSPHVSARLTVVRVAARSGRSYAASGAANCIRSAVPARSGATALKAGHSYRVSFYARAGTGRSSARKLAATRELTARAFTAPAAGLGTPHC